MTTEFRGEEWTVKLLTRGFQWSRRSSSPFNLTHFEGSGKFGFARYQFGTIQVDRLCGRHIDAITEAMVPLPHGDTWYQRAKPLLAAGQLDVTANSKLNTHTCHYFELNGDQFTVAAVVVEHSVRREDYDHNGYAFQDEFQRLIPLYFEFVGDERAYRNAINMALFQLA